MPLTAAICSGRTVVIFRPPLVSHPAPALSSQAAVLTAGCPLFMWVYIIHADAQNDELDYWARALGLRYKH